MTTAMDIHETAPSLDERDLKPNAGLGAEDRDAMNAIGKKQVFKRRFNFWSALGLIVCISATWEGMSAALLQVMTEAGPVGILYGFIVSAIAMIIIAMVISELASIWPSSGAQYHWIAELSPVKYRAAFSWFGGWVTLTYVWLATCSCAMGVAVQAQAYAMMGNPTYAASAQRWHAYLIYLLVTIIFTLVNVFAVRFIHHLNLSGIAVHVIGYFLTLIVMAVMTKDKHDAKFVFATFINSSGWSSDGVSFCIGLLTSVYGFGGIDTAAHFSEEIKNVRRNVPRAIVWTVVANAIITWPWLITLLYCLGDLNSVLASPVSLLSPITVIFVNASRNTGLGIFMASVSTYLAFVGGIDAMGSTARTLFALSRDNAFPEIFHRVSPKYDVPVWSILICGFLQALLGLIYIGNTTAFYGILSGVLVLYMISFMLCISLHIFSKLSKREIEYGPWNLGRWSMPLNLVALAWTIFTVIFFCFPLYQPVSAQNMNYASVIVGFVIISGVAWWFMYLRGRFEGPVVEIIDDIDVEILEAPVSRMPTVDSQQVNKVAKK